MITRAVGIASLPITQLQNDLTGLQSQSTALTGMGTKFAALQSAVEGIQSAMGGASYQATVSDPAKLSVALGDGAMEGIYAVNVVNAGAYATSMTTGAWDGTGTHAYELTLDGGAHKYGITTTDNNITGVAAAINAQYSDKVRAIVVNVGSSSAPDYRLSLQAVQLGAVTPDVLDNGSALPAQYTAGAQAQYIVNNSGTTVSSSSRSVSIAQGVTVNLLSASGGNVNITVTRSTTALSEALSQFATAYNAAVDEVDKQHGTAAGALSGQTVVAGLSQSLSDIATYSSGGGIGGLADLGVTLDTTGHMTFSPFALMAADLSNSAGVASFLGSVRGGGFLKSATGSLSRVEDPVLGSIAAAESDVKNRITDTNTRIDTKQGQVDQLQQRLLEQMSAADALIAAMEQQYTYISSMFQAMDTASKQYR